MLLAECAAAGVDLRVGHNVTEITRADRFRIETDRGSFVSSAIVLATGGLSIPQLGPTSFAYDAARRFALNGIEPKPELARPKVNGERPARCQALSRASGATT